MLLHRLTMLACLSLKHLLKIFCSFKAYSETNHFSSMFLFYSTHQIILRYQFLEI